MLQSSAVANIPKIKPFLAKKNIEKATMCDDNALNLLYLVLLYSIS